MSTSRRRSATKFCPGYFTLPGISLTVTANGERRHGMVAMELRAIAQSCDVYFYDLANDDGRRSHRRVRSRRSGSASLTGIDIGGERQGILPSPAMEEAAHSRTRPTRCGSPARR